MDYHRISYRISGAAAGMAKKYRESLIKKVRSVRTNYQFFEEAAEALLQVAERIVGQKIDFDFGALGDAVPDFTSLLHEFEHVLLDNSFNLRNFQFNNENAIDGLAAEVFLDDLASFQSTNVSGQRWINVFGSMVQEVFPDQDMTIFSAIDKCNGLTSSIEGNKPLVDKILRRIKSDLESNRYAQLLKTTNFFEPSKSKHFPFSHFQADQRLAYQAVNKIFAEHFGSLDVSSTPNSRAEEVFIKFYRSATPAIMRLLEKHKYRG